MPEYLAPVDIGNRAAQHVGADKLMDQTLGFTENSKLARQISFCYGKLRKAELERNVWTFATRRAALRPIDTTTMLLQPTVWSSLVTYYNGSIVTDGAGTPWISRVQNNLNNDPQNSATWEPYFGPLTVTLYNSTLIYLAGELVYTTAGDGTYRVYLSQISNNSDNPATATSWSATSTYSKTDGVTYLSVAYQSLIDLNIAQTPSASPAVWAAGTTYGIAAHVCGSDGVIYSSIAGGNVGHDPVSTGGVYWTNTGVLCPWTTVFTGGAGSLNWLEIGGAEFPSGVGLTTMNIVYPIGAGPSSQAASLNAYRLPAGYLRLAPQDPKAGGSSYLGSPTGLLYTDWLYEGDFIVTRETGVILLRFVADVQDVTKMKTMFCEGLAARIGMEICETMTQSTAKVGTITQAYNKVMGEARTVNAIEAGSEEPPLDDWIACRA